MIGDRYETSYKHVFEVVAEDDLDVRVMSVNRDGSTYGLKMRVAKTYPPRYWKKIR